MKQNHLKKLLLTALMLTVTLTLTSCDSGNDRQNTYELCDEALEYSDSGQYDKAIELLDKAIKADPSCDLAYYVRADAYKLNKQYDKALADYDKIIELNPNDSRVSRVYEGRGLVYYKVGEFGKAIADYTKSLDLEPERQFVYRFRARAYEAIGKDDLAKADRDKAEELEQKENEQFLMPAITPATEE